MYHHYLCHSVSTPETEQTTEPLPIYSTEQLRSASIHNIPHHVAIIPDGNRRWAKKHMLKVDDGHREGGDVLFNIIKAASELGVKIITIYSFSTENWNRNTWEVRAFMELIVSSLRNRCEEMIKQGVRLATIGDLTRLPPYVIRTIEEVKAATAAGKKIDLVLALNYGGRDEICRAVHKITQDCLSNKLQKDHITEEVISKYLDTAEWPDPELLIRTSGEMRISNFLLWQLSYTEVHSARVLWPDFTPQHFLEAVISYQQRERRLGGL